MKNATSTISLIIGLLLGAVAGHYHGKAQVYQGMFGHYERLAEVME